MPKTLLLADDSVVIQKLVGLSFANEDIELVTTDNGEDALARAREIRPDMVLADVVMPGKNGYEVCASIKTDPATSHIPVLLLTGTFEAFDEDRARQVGSNGHITKPFEAQGLVDRVTELLAQAPAPAPPVASPPAPRSPLMDEGLGTESAHEAPSVQPADDAYDFFDDSAPQDLASAGVAKPAAPAAAPAPAPSLDDVFEFGSDLDPLEDPDAGSPDTLDTSFELEGPDDATVAVASESVPSEPVPPLSRDLDAPDATKVALAETIVADDFAVPQPARVESLDERLVEPGPAPAVDLEAPTLPPSVPPAVPAGDLFEEPAPPITKPTPAAPPPVSKTTPPPPPPVSKAAPPAPAPIPDPPAEVADSGFEFGFEPSSPAVETARSTPATPPPVEQSPEPALDTTDELDPLEDIGPEPPELSSLDGDPSGYDSAPHAPALADAADSTHDGYDVSMSDLGAPVSPLEESRPALGAPAVPERPVAFAEPPAFELPAARESRPATEAASAAPDPRSEEIGAGIGISDPEPIPAEAPAAGALGPDLSPVMRERVHETLEKVAWEAFADVSDSIVRQALERVEAIVWEVVPQMAEALIQEEIRRMKGEE